MLDTETLSLQRGSGVHELSVFNLGTGQMSEYLLTPNLVQLAAGLEAQETTRLATSSLDVHKLVQDDTWFGTMRRTLKMDNPKLGELATNQEVFKALEVAQPWLAKSLQNYPHLLGRTESSSQRATRLERLQREGGVRSMTTQTVSPEELLRTGGLLEQHLTQPDRGITLWGANVSFDAKQIGSLIGGLEAEGIATNLKARLQTSGSTGDPFYTTGVEFNRAKVAAQQSGDWTQVWQAMLKDQPKAGEVAVRDIQDVTRSMMSYGQKLGLLSEGDVYWGSSLDLQHRLLGSLQGGAAGVTALGGKEVHRAAEDLAIHSQAVLKSHLRYTAALQSVYEGTGAHLLEQATKKQGDLFEAATLLARMEVLKPDIQEISLIQRLGRAQQDLLEQGKTYQVDGWKAVSELTQHSPSQGEVSVPILRPNRVTMTSLDEVTSLLRAQGRYGPEVDLATYAQEVRQAIEPGTDLDSRKQLLTQYLESETANKLEEHIAARTDLLMKTFQRNIGQTVSRAAQSGQSIGQAATVLSKTKVPALLAGWGAFAAATATAGIVWSTVSGNSKPTRDQPSLVTYNYEDWLARQAEFSNSRPLDEQNQGMSERGIAGATRRRNTDFGSPYQGIMGSQMVFDNQELLNERENWLREQYGVKHFDPIDGLFGMNGILARARHSGYSYLPGGESVESGYKGLKGKHLMRVNLGSGDWKMSVDDADTIVLKQGGLSGAVKSIFGLNKGYSFRLAGVDSPEIEHGQSFGAQPHAYQSMQALQQLLGSGENAELVFNPDNSTYGRSMGVVFNEGKNVNYELLKRGWAGFLPYGKSSDSMIDYEVMKGMEIGARGSSRGMWQHPFWQVIYDTTQGNDRPTFNTLTKADKIAPKKSLIDSVSLAQQAQDQGFYSTGMMTEAARIGQFTHRGIDQVKPVVTGGDRPAHYEDYLGQMMSDTSQFMKTKGSTRSDSAGAFSHRSGYQNLDKTLVLDSMGHTNSVWGRKKLASFGRYGTGDQMARDRRERMVIAQQSINGSVFNSLQNHTNFQIGG